MGFLGKRYLIGNEAGLEIFDAIRDLPIVDAHNHANVAEIAANEHYSDLWQLFAATDHYVWEVMRKCGVEEEYITGKNRTPREKFLKLAEVFPLIAGNPVYEWIHLDLKRYIGIDEILGPDTGAAIWEKGNRRLAKDCCRPRALLEKINVEVMCSTDDPVDSLEHHDTANRAFGRTVLRPTWRPDKAMKIANPGWREYMKVLAKRFNMTFKSAEDVVEALRQSHDYFAVHGCIASDHGLEFALSGTAAYADADAAFKKAMAGETLSTQEVEDFMSYILGEAAAMNALKGWVFQYHLGAVRDVRSTLWESLGPDVGGDVSNHFQNPLPALCGFLNRFDGKLKVVLYVLDPGQQPTMATLARAFGSTVRLGSAWWLCDTPVGMKRQLEYIGSVDVLSQFAGMVSDSRKLLSYGSRFEMFRRVLSDVLGSMVERGQMPREVARELAITMAYTGQKKFFGL